MSTLTTKMWLLAPFPFPSFHLQNSPFQNLLKEERKATRKMEKEKTVPQEIEKEAGQSDQKRKTETTLKGNKQLEAGINHKQYLS